MTRGPRYVPRWYRIEGREMWKVYDTYMQVPHTDSYETREQAAKACKAGNKRNEKKGG